MPSKRKPGPGPLALALASVLEDARRSQGMSQSELAAAIGISQAQVSDYLRGLKVPDVNEVDAAITALGLDSLAVMAEAYRRRPDYS